VTALVVNIFVTSVLHNLDLKEMSLQVNLSSKGISQAYQDVINANGIDWVILTYEKGSNDLKVQATGDGGLEELAEEFSDGRYLSGYSMVLSSFNVVH